MLDVRGTAWMQRVGRDARHYASLRTPQYCGENVTAAVWHHWLRVMFVIGFERSALATIIIAPYVCLSFCPLPVHPLPVSRYS